MVPKTNLTIRDYFNQAAIQLSGHKSAPSRPVSANRHQESFSAILKTAQGLSIKDYLANPVRADRPGQPRSVDHPRATVPTPLAPTPSSPSHTDVIEISPAVTRRMTTDPSPAKGDRQKAKIARSIENAARQFDLAPELLHAVVKAESDYQVRAVSPAGAQGLMQLMPATAAELGVEDPFDIEQNIRGGARYLRRMLDRFDGKLRLALAAYNAGPGAVSKYANQIPPYTETAAYVERVLNFSRQGIVG